MILRVGNLHWLEYLLAFSRFLGHFPRAMIHHFITALITLNCYYYYNISKIMLMLINFLHNCQNSWNSLQLKASYMNISALFRLSLIVLFIFMIVNSVQWWFSIADMKTRSKWSDLFVKLLVLSEGKSGHNMTTFQFLLKFSLTRLFFLTE